MAPSRSGLIHERCARRMPVIRASHERARMPQCPPAAATTASFQAGHVATNDAAPLNCREMPGRKPTGVRRTPSPRWLRLQPCREVQPVHVGQRTRTAADMSDAAHAPDPTLAGIPRQRFCPDTEEVNPCTQQAASASDSPSAYQRDSDEVSRSRQM
jgi:hypothetical protein